MAKLIWKRTGRLVSLNGSSVFYRAAGTNYEIISRKRHIPHANGVGTWDHTTYWVVLNGKDIKERYSLADAKEYVEKLMGGEV